MLAIWEIRVGCAKAVIGLEKGVPEVSIGNWKASKVSTLMNRKTNSFVIPNLIRFKEVELKGTSLSFLYLCS